MLYKCQFLQDTTIDMEEVKFSVAIPLTEYSIVDLPDSDGK